MAAESQTTDGREAFKRNLANAVADTDNVPPTNISYPVSCRMVIHDGPKAQIFDATLKPCLPGFIADEEAAATLVNWINQLSFGDEEIRRLRELVRITYNPACAELGPGCVEIADRFAGILARAGV